MKKKKYRNKKEDKVWLLNSKHLFLGSKNLKIEELKNYFKDFSKDFNFLECKLDRICCLKKLLMDKKWKYKLNINGQLGVVLFGGLSS